MFTVAFRALWNYGKHGVLYVWSQTAGGAQAWTTGGNWVGSVAPVTNAYDKVDFSQANIVADTTLTLGADRKGSYFKFGDAVAASHNWIVSAGNSIILDGEKPTIDVVNRFVTLNCVLSTRRVHKLGLGGLILANASNINTESLYIISAGELRATAVGAIPNGSSFIFDGPIINAAFLQLTNAASVGFTGGQIIVTAGAYGRLYPSTGNAHSYLSAKSGSNDSKLELLGNGNSAITISDASLFTGILQVGSGSGSSPTLVLGNLTDDVGYGQLRFGGSVAGSAVFSFFGNTMPLIINNRVFEILAGGGTTNGPSIANNNASASNPVVINTDLLNNKTGALTLVLGGANTGANAFNGLISNGAGTLAFTKSGGSTWTLGNVANSYTGITSLNAGILIISKIADAAVPCCIGANPSAAEGQLVLFSGELRYTGTGDSTNRLFRISSNVMIRNEGSGALVFSNTGQLGTNNASAKTLTLAGSNTDANTIACSFLVVSASLSLTKSGVGRWILTNSNNTSLSGTITLTAGILEITTATSIGSGALDTSAGTGVLRLTGLTTVQIGGLTGSGDLATRIEAGGYSSVTALTLNLPSGKTLTHSGIIHDGAVGMTLTKIGVGSQTLSGANSYTGETILTAGTLVTGADNNLGSGGAQIRCNGNATWNMGGAVIITYNRPLVIDSGFTLGITSGNNTKTLTGILNGDGTLSVAVTTSIIFSNSANTFTGPVISSTGNSTGYGLGFASIGDSSNTISLLGNAGTFRWISASGSPTTLANRVFQSTNIGQITFSALGTSGSSLVIQQSLVINGTVGARTIRLAGTNTDANTISGIIPDGAGSVVSITKVEAGLWVLSGANTYTGTTDISAGTLRFDTANSLGGSGLLISGTGKAHLNYAGNRNITSLTLGGVLQASGSYGATGSGATFINDTYFLGTGTVTVP